MRPIVSVIGPADRKFLASQWVDVAADGALMFRSHPRTPVQSFEDEGLLDEDQGVVE